MRISVTQTHIDMGSIGDSDNCPVALAAFDAGLVAPSVGPVSLSHGMDALNVTRHRLPDSVINFVRDFDADKQVKPFEFEIDA